MSIISAKTKVTTKKLLWLVVLGIILAGAFYSEKHNNLLNYKQTTSVNNIDKIYKLRKVKIILEDRDYDFLFSDLPLSMRTYQKAILLADNQPKVYNIDFRLRGNHAWHWYKEQPSFRVRTSSKDLLYSRKELDFINPEDASGFSNVLSEFMASNIGIAHIDMSFCQVHINGHYKGLYQITDRPCSTTLKSQDGITGPVVTGNDWNLEKWTNEKLWEYEQEKVGNLPNLKLQAELEGKMKYLIDNLKDPLNLTAHQNLTAVLDIDKTAQWSAFMTIIGSVHTDDFHNLYFCYDKTKKIYFPFITDPSGFGILTSISNKNTLENIRIPIYEFLTPLVNSLFRDPEFQFKRNNYIYSYLTKQLTKDFVSETVNEWRKYIEPLYYQEKNYRALITAPKLIPIRIPVSPEYRIKDIDRLVDYYKARYDFLMEELGNSEAIIQSYDCPNPDGIKQFVISVKGNAPIKWNLPKIFLNKIYLDNNMDKIITTQESCKITELLLYPALTKISAMQIKIPPEYTSLMIFKRLAKYMLTPEYQTYLIGINTDYEKQILNELIHNGKNAITGAKVKINLKREPLNQYMLYRNKDSIHVWSKHE